MKPKYVFPADVPDPGIGVRYTRSHAKAIGLLQLIWVPPTILTVAGVVFRQTLSMPAFISSPWFVAMAIYWPIFVVIQRRFQKHLRRVAEDGYALCPNCGYDLSPDRLEGRCSECGEDTTHEKRVRAWVRAGAPTPESVRELGEPGTENPQPEPHHA
ncbi:MAG: hypothetical protein AAF747_07825 [Planctomycetota bacterium]